MPIKHLSALRPDQFPKQEPVLKTAFLSLKRKLPQTQTVTAVVLYTLPIFFLLGLYIVIAKTMGINRGLLELSPTHYCEVSLLVFKVFSYLGFLVATGISLTCARMSIKHYLWLRDRNDFASCKGKYHFKSASYLN